MKVQQQVPSLDGDQPPDRAIRFRVGINIGDAIADGTDLHGDNCKRDGEAPGKVLARRDLYLAISSRSHTRAARSST